MTGKRTDNRTSRRALLGSAALAAAGGALTACTVQTGSVWQGAPLHPILPSPRPAGARPPATPLPGGVDLEGFLALSSVLTGFDDLDPVLGRTYLLSLQTRENPEASVGELYERAGFAGPAPPHSVDELDAAGVFDTDALNALADTIITYWYTGIYDSGGEQVVATYVDSLAWQAIGYTKPRSICGPYPGFWRERPPVIP
jgi:hypothetical protein